MLCGGSCPCGCENQLIRVKIAPEGRKQGDQKADDRISGRRIINLSDDVKKSGKQKNKYPKNEICFKPVTGYLAIDCHGVYENFTSTFFLSSSSALKNSNDLKLNIFATILVGNICILALKSSTLLL